MSRNFEWKVSSFSHVRFKRGSSSRRQSSGIALLDRMRIGDGENRSPAWFVVWAHNNKRSQAKTSIAFHTNVKCSFSFYRASTLELFHVGSVRHCVPEQITGRGVVACRAELTDLFRDAMRDASSMEMGLMSEAVPDSAADIKDHSSLKCRSFQSPSQAHDADVKEQLAGFALSSLHCSSNAPGRLATRRTSEAWQPVSKAFE